MEGLPSNGDTDSYLGTDVIGALICLAGVAVIMYARGHAEIGRDAGARRFAALLVEAADAPDRLS